MEVHKAFTSAKRTVSATSLRERLSSLSSLTTTPLKPVANLHAQIECVRAYYYSYPCCLFLVSLRFPSLGDWVCQDYLDWTLPCFA